jgi:SRSO17 transposase
MARTPAHRRHGRQALPGEEAWLIGEYRSTGERKYYPSNLPADCTLKALAVAVKARWACEQAHQQLKEELGLDHFEGRSRRELHGHVLMTMIAYAFLQSSRLAQADGGKKNPRPAAAAKPPAIRQAIPDQFFPSHPRRCPHCKALLMGNLPK